ncbi:hypothetical protein HRG_012012 [Hirsutella rhossiliensis]|uniref:Uncharacterized protein n=1 Tax=Hirsutella rhossiliensis TaxID=111463 RepID=A0A9P8MKX8_9HYPO|nr:uncharacterized protein HRG_12012 [Hirsutella rhossiliensis]KAH0956919.1 hypothetical protein HRG_12012 [Hirsutella rhossiliensis]
MEIQYRDSLPDDVRSGFDKAVEVLPQEHLRAPVTGDEVNSPEEALHWFQNYAFTHTAILVTIPWIFCDLGSWLLCIRHGPAAYHRRSVE